MSVLFSDLRQGEQVETLTSTPETALGDKRPRDDDEDEEGADMNANQPPSSSRPGSAAAASSSSGGNGYTTMLGQTPNNANGTLTGGPVNDALYIGDLQWVCCFVVTVVFSTLNIFSAVDDG